MKEINEIIEENRVALSEVCKQQKISFVPLTGICNACGSNMYHYDENKRTFVCDKCGAEVYGLGRPFDDLLEKTSVGEVLVEKDLPVENATDLSAEVGSEANSDEYNIFEATEIFNLKMKCCTFVGVLLACVLVLAVVFTIINFCSGNIKDLIVSILAIVLCAIFYAWMYKMEGDAYEEYIGSDNARRLFRFR